MSLGFEHGNKKLEGGKEENLFSDSYKLYYSEATLILNLFQSSI